MNEHRTWLALIMCTALGLTISCDGGERNGSAPAAEGDMDRLVNLKVVKVGADGKQRVVSDRNITVREQLAMNERRATFQQRMAGKGESAIKQLASTVEGDCGDPWSLWLNSEPNQGGDRICLITDGVPNHEFELIGCPFEEPRPVFQVKSYWAGYYAYRLWSKVYFDNCSSIVEERTLATGCGNKVDNFGPPYPQYATVGTAHCRIE
jgi:hypothetical protein